MKLLLYRLKRIYHFLVTGLRGWWAAIQTGHPEKKLKVILVTGTDGKTTTATLVYRLLQSAGYKVGLLTTVAAYIGDQTLDTGFHVTSPAPQDLYRYMKQMVDAGLEYLVLELTSQGAYQWRAWGVKAEIAGLTNIDREHLDYHLTFDNYLRAKMLVLNAAATVVVNDSGEYFAQVKRELHPGKKLVTFNGQSSFGEEIDEAVKTRFAADYNRLNAKLALTMVRELGVPQESWAAAIKEFKLPAGRMEVVPNELGVTMIVDFAHTPQALSAAITAIKQNYLRPGAKMIGIAGCAGLRYREKRPVMGRILAENCDIAIFTAEDPRTENVWAIIAQMKSDLTPYHGRVISIADREQALEYALTHFGRDGNVIAIFGKGHEQSMNYDGQTEVAWNDIEGAKKIMAKLADARQK